MTTYPTPKADFKRHYRMERLCRRAETGWGEDGPVVNLRHDGKMVLVEYAGNYWAMSPTAALAASRIFNRAPDPLPTHFGSVLAAAKVKANDIDTEFTDIFGKTSPADYLAGARRPNPPNRQNLTLPELLLSANSQALHQQRGRLAEAATDCTSDIDTESILAQIRAIDAEIKRRYISPLTTLEI